VESFALCSSWTMLNPSMHWWAVLLKDKVVVNNVFNSICHLSRYEDILASDGMY